MFLLKELNLLKIVILVYLSIKIFSKKKNITGKVNATVKKYLAQVICKTGNSELRYFANPSIIGSITQAKRLKIIAFIDKRYRLIKVF